MRRVIFFILALLLMAGPALGYDMLIVQSTRNPAYDDILRGFRSACGAGSRIVVLSDYAETDVPRIVREERPRLVVVLGDEALASVKKIRQTPVLALMTLGLHAPGNPRANVTGVDLFAPPELYVPVFRALKRDRIGIIYNPAKTGWYVKRAIATAQRAGFRVTVREVHNPRETVTRLSELKGKVDALWMVPDTTAIMKETLEAYFTFSLEQSVPVVSFAAPHLRIGATAVIDIDRAGLGRQAGEMANRLLSGSSPADIPVATPRTTSLKSNSAVLKNLGFSGHLLDRLSLVKE